VAFKKKLKNHAHKISDIFLNCKFNDPKHDISREKKASALSENASSPEEPAPRSTISCSFYEELSKLTMSNKLQINQEVRFT